MVLIRIDKFLKNSRIIKRRTVSKQACEQGRVSINDKIAKPGDVVKLGDNIKIRFGTRDVNIEVMMIKDNVGKDDAINLYKEI